MLTILATIFVFGVIVFIHEFGHFITAKASGMRVDEFAIGFGPALVKKQKGETLYSIRAIPLGGYNKIAGMMPDEELDDRSFLNKPVWKRFIVIFAGAFFNFLLAIVIFFGVFVTYGQQTPSNEPVIGRIVNDSPAIAAHLEVNDRITSINGKAITQWSDITTHLKGTENTVVTMMIDRGGETKEVSVIPTESSGRAIIGINPQINSTPYSIGEAAERSVTATIAILQEMVRTLWLMITGQMAAQVSGPIGVAQAAGEMAQFGFVYLLNFTAILSLNLGVINLLPVPALDGGHLILLIIEGITRRRMPPKALQYIQMTGVILLIALFIYATTHDISRL
ncbi:RIP metalloprotease RseP [uncultured Veillonella sp.]|uniref:RIP metalloprotease RseP n=1 Tax=uncultured Veillonella sp. TaxID=159268 RepID=UPI0025EE4C9A|nr:RIP metalloprotease RseP [uncultured Veillonella sp.]MDY3973781.1 RIP metalloprotease RseP [Veillonella caviae]